MSEVKGNYVGPILLPENNHESTRIILKRCKRSEVGFNLHYSKMHTPGSDNNDRSDRYDRFDRFFAAGVRKAKFVSRREC
jgi:hypothetical protein